MDQSAPFEQVLAQLRQRDNEGATEVYRRFCGRLIALAHHRLDPRLRQRVDPEDVAQSALKSVVLRLAEGEFDLGDWDGLWGLLTRVTIHKCHRWVDYFQAQRRQFDRELSPPADADNASVNWQFLDSEPTPPEAALFAETLERLLHGLEEREQDMVTLSLQGCEVAEISAKLSCTQSKVYRVLRLIRQRLEGMRDEE
jgi:RNA polymerase sigma-70 factor (ECF subfamily)